MTVALTDPVYKLVYDKDHTLTIVHARTEKIIKRLFLAHSYLTVDLLPVDELDSDVMEMTRLYFDPYHTYVKLIIVKRRTDEVIREYTLYPGAEYLLTGNRCYDLQKRVDTPLKVAC